MGLKSGSRDAGLDDEEEPDEGDANTDQGVQDEATDTAPSSSPETASSESDHLSTAAGSERPSMDSIPYKLRRNKVNEGREQVPYFLREEVIAGEQGLQDSLEEMLGEDVYKSDYREAAMVVAQRNPELVAEVLREWGYDLD